MKIFRRPESLARHIRTVHGSDSWRKCPFCSPDSCAWKHANLLKMHLVKDHSEELGEDGIEQIRFLTAKKNLLRFVDTIAHPRS